MGSRDMRDARAALDPGDGLTLLTTGLGPWTDRVWITGNVIGLGLALVAAFLAPRHGLAFAYLAVMLRLALYTLAAARPAGEYFDRMVRLGLIAGFFAIFADYVLVRVLPSGQLVYLTRDAVLLESPVYMPFAWACIIVEFGYVPVRLHARLRGTPRGAWLVALPGGVTAGIGIAIYEYLAFRAGWWKYEPAAMMIGAHCAAYIPVGESLMFMVMLPFLASLGRTAIAPRRWALLGGIGFAAIILASYLVAYLMLEGAP
jgi:Domain of unknown function (DUF6989)